VRIQAGTSRSTTQLPLSVALACAALALSGCGDANAPMPSPGEGAVGLVDVPGSTQDHPIDPAAGGPSGQAPTTGPARAPQQELTTTPGAGR